MRDSEGTPEETSSNPLDPPAVSPSSQSLFSLRSGIQDPLIRQEGRAGCITRDDPRTDDLNENDLSIQMPDGELITETEPVLETQKLIDDLQKRRRKKKLKVLYRRFRLLIKFVCSILGFILIWQVWRSPIWVYGAPFLQEPNFTMEHAQLLASSQLLPLIRPLVHHPIYQINTGQLAKQIKSSFAIVDQVAVRRKLFPARLDIQILEKQPWAEVYTDKSQIDSGALPYALITPSGFLNLAPYHYQSTLYQNHPPVKVLIQPRTIWSLADLNHLHEIIWQAQQIQGLHLLSVDSQDPNQVVFQFQEIPVILGPLNHTASTRLARLIPLLPKINEFRDDIEAVDLRWEEQVTLHQKPQTDIAQPEQEDTGNAHPPN